MCAAPKDLSSIFAPTELLDHIVGISSPNSVRNGDTADGMNCGLVKIRLTHKSIVELVNCSPPMSLWFL